MITWRIGMRCSAVAMPEFSQILEDAGAAVVASPLDPDATQGPWTVDGFFRIPPDYPGIGTTLSLAAAAMGEPEPHLSVQLVTVQAWLQSNLQSFPPLTIDRIRVRGSHVDTPAPPGMIDLRIGAATAFGTGEHGSTAGCLRAMQRLAKRRPARTVLDLGCGSGILAIAAASLWPATVIAVDIDPEAVRVTKRNARRNRVRLRALCDKSPDRARRLAGRSFDLVVANILAKPLVRLSPAVAASVAPGGTVILSGLLRRQERMVLSAYRRQGLALDFRIRQGEWSTLALRK